MRKNSGGRLLVGHAVPSARRPQDARTHQGTTPHGTHRLAAGNGIGGERRHFLHIESGTRGRRGACDSQRHFSRRRCRLVAGAMSMATGEYVSVHSQADTEEAELKLERAELKADDRGEHKELMAI